MVLPSCRHSVRDILLCNFEKMHWVNCSCTGNWWTTKCNFYETINGLSVLKIWIFSPMYFMYKSLYEILWIISWNLFMNRVLALAWEKKSNKLWVLKLIIQYLMFNYISVHRGDSIVWVVCLRKILEKISSTLSMGVIGDSLFVHLCLFFSLQYVVGCLSV